MGQLIEMAFEKRYLHFSWPCLYILYICSPVTVNIFGVRREILLVIKSAFDSYSIHILLYEALGKVFLTRMPQQGRNPITVTTKIYNKGNLGELVKLNCDCVCMMSCDRLVYPPVLGHSLTIHSC